MRLCARCQGLLLASGSPVAVRSALARYLMRSKSNKAKSINTDLFTPPTFGRLEVGEQAPLVNAYTTNGFVVRNSFVYGSVALLPRTLLNWKVTKVKDITADSFALFHLVQPKIDLIVLGTGTRVERLDPAIIEALKRKGLSLEIQDTPNACATFNFLLAEGRPAGAALIPPHHIPP